MLNLRRIRNLLFASAIPTDFSHGRDANLANEIIGIGFVFAVADGGVVRVLNGEQVSSLLDVIGAAEESVHFFEHNVLGFGNADWRVSLGAKSSGVGP